MEGGSCYTSGRIFPLKLLKNIPTRGGIVCLFVKLTFIKRSGELGVHTTRIIKCMGLFVQSYDNIIIMGDFNCEPLHQEIVDFCDLYNFKNIVKHPTCFKNRENPSCIDLILTNKR